MIVLQLAFTYVPFMNRMFHSAPIGWDAWWRILLDGRRRLCDCGNRKVAPSQMAFLEIIRDVIKEKRDLVITTAEGTTGLTDRLFGSTSLNLMRKCPCPILVMKPARRKRFTKIMAAIDPDPEDVVRSELNGTILELASSLATLDEAELHVAHAWTFHGEHLLRRPGQVPEAEIQVIVQQEADRHQAMLDALIAKHTTGNAQVHMLKGTAESVITELARKKKVDLLVMGTVCRTGIPGFFIGNAAETILGQVDCSVLTVKPKGFQSPVHLA
jgi:universal stress protein E